MRKDRAIDAIDEAGILLVFPIKNQKLPQSLWSVFFPRSKMRWEWDESGDNRVGDLWHLRSQLSKVRDVVYAKWYLGRATFFSHESFVAALAALGSARTLQSELSAHARAILEALEEDSPQSPRMLREQVNLVGKFNGPVFEKALRELWSRLLIVGYGEIDDGAFPSLAIGASRTLYEDLWEESLHLSCADGLNRLKSIWGEDSLWIKYLLRIIERQKRDRK